MNRNTQTQAHGPSLPDQVAACLRSDILTGKYQAGERLPSEHALAERHNVSRRTIRVAVMKLVEDGWLDRQDHCSPVVHPWAGQEDAAPPVAPVIEPSRFVALIMWRSDVEDVEEASAQQVFAGMHDTLKRVGYHSVFFDAGYEFGAYRYRVDREEDHLTYAHQQGFGGAIYHPQAGGCRPELLQVLSRRMPLVLINRLPAGIPLDFAGSDHCKAGYDATRHLIDQGHRRIAFVSDGRNPAREQEWLCGFQQAIREASPRGAGGTVVAPPLKRGMDRVLGSLAGERADGITAVVCAGAQVADWLVSYFAARSLRVPDDISLIGFGIPRRVLPNGVGLTTVSQSGEQLGRSAAKLLLYRFENSGTRPTHVQLSHKLMERGSIRDLNKGKGALTWW